MRAALEFVTDDHYRRESFSEYLEKADPPLLFDDEDLTVDALCSRPPYALDRWHYAAERPLLVIFEQPDCHACDVFHTEPLQQKVIRQRLDGYEIVQLNVWDDKTPVLTPDGRKLTPKEWAVQLGLFYTPTLVFFDEWGNEVIRIDSVLQFYRLGGVLRYVVEKGYLEEPIYHQWARKHVKEENEIFCRPAAGAGFPHSGKSLDTSPASAVGIRTTGTNDATVRCFANRIRPWTHRTL